MSKLDDILKPVKLEGGNDYLLIVDKQQIKDLMLGIVDDLNGGDWRKPINSDDLRQEIEEL